MGLVFVSVYWMWGDTFIIDPSNSFAHEHDLAQTFTGTLYILGIQAIMISAFLILEKKNIRLNVPIVSWVGLNSLLVFAFHRIFFVRILAPLSVMIGTQLNRTIGASTIELYSYIGITLAMAYFIKVSKMGDLILARKG